ncbi:MAG: ribonuclease III [Lachnospiraceae bacterium]|nr:ribonuclease III [Lachnospiraceae bacterium]
MNINENDIKRAAEEAFGLGAIDPKSCPPLTLAYIGDAFIELCVRSYVVMSGRAPASKLHRETVSFVNAESQAELLRAMEPELTDEEKDICRRGRNAKSNTRSKNASITDYRKATGLEALAGYLYLEGRAGRFMELFRDAVENTGMTI